MTARITMQGHYRLLETRERNRLLVLNDDRRFVWVNGSAGELLIHAGAHRADDRVVAEGRFLVVAFEQDRRFDDGMHLFLREGDRYRAVRLDEGLPTDAVLQCAVCSAEAPFPCDELERHLRRPEDGDGAARRDGAARDGGAWAALAPLLDGVIFPATRDDLLRRARRQRVDDALLDRIEELGTRRFASAADVERALREQEARREARRGAPPAARAAGADAPEARA